MSVRACVWFGLAAIACYLPHILTGQFVYEDATMVSSIGLEPLGPRWLTRSLWSLQWSAFPSPQVFHAVSLALHALNAVLATVLARRLGLGWPAAQVAGLILFGHRLGVESVAYAAQQGELIAAAGVLTACILATFRWWRPMVAAAIIGAFGVGILGKESAVVACILVPLVVWLTQDRHSDRPLYAAPWLPAVIGLEVLVAGAYYLTAGGFRGTVNIGQDPGATVTAIDWLLVQAPAAVRTLGLLIPFVSTPTPDYDYDIIPMAWRWASLLTLGGLVVGGWCLRKSRPLEAFAVAGMLTVILPRLLIQTPRSNFNDHQAYLFLPFFGLLVAALVERVRARAEGLRHAHLSEPHKGALLRDLPAWSREGEAGCV